MTAVIAAPPLAVVKTEPDTIPPSSSQFTDRIALLHRKLADSQDELRFHLSLWDEERARILEETEAITREEDQTIAKLRAENEKLRQTDIDIAEEPMHSQAHHSHTILDAKARRSEDVAGSDPHSGDDADDIEVLGCISVKGNDAEGNPVKFRQVILTKPEDGDMLWDLRRLRLGPTMEVTDPRHRKTFTRRMLSQAFGGGFQETYHHSRQPNHPDWYATYNPTWNPQLPDVGQHGVAFDDVHTDRLLPVFILVRTNAWRYCGHYSVTMWGELNAIQIARLPRNCLDTMVHDYAHLKNGQRAVDGRDAKNKKEAQAKGLPYRPIVRTGEGIMEAFLDGRMVQLFTILQFHHYDEVWFERLLAVEPAVAEEERVIAQKRKEKEEAKKRLKDAGKKEARAGTKRKATSTGARGDGSQEKRKAKVKRKGPVEDGSDSNIEFVGVSIPAESRRTSRRLNTLSSGRISQIVRELDEEDEDEDEGWDTELESDSDEGF
ncbi:hypothetical protein K523DRAFT_417029 [Schizophyllum commune Tattone D]|nr:hypothetical protein K523DRAFT_417029 [Schizophyllum commune Tattone D]